MPTAVKSVDDAIRVFAEAADAPPNGALRWALDHWDIAAPRFLEMARDYADGTDETDITTDALFFIVHLFGDKAERRAFPILCRLMLDEDRLIAALGDTACVETLKGVLIKCYDGDATPLRAVIESPEAESITRGEALLALAWLARDGRFPEAEFRDYMRRLLTEMRPREADFIWYNWVLVASIMGYAEFAGDAVKLIADGMVPEEWLTLAELPELQAAGDPTGKNGLLSEDVAPFDDVIGSLAEWPWDEDFDDDELEMEEPPGTPYINPLRHVGRNDPCPCGSGKKFKNCHLVAE